MGSPKEPHRNGELVWTFTILVSSLFSLMTRTSNSPWIGVTLLGPRWRDVYEGKYMENDVWLRKKNKLQLANSITMQQ